MAVLTAGLTLGFAGAALAQALPSADPGSVGMSSDRLDRIGDAFQAEIDAGELPGVVVMVARDGKLVYSTALGDPALGSAYRVLYRAVYRRLV
ncbi:hypothetical protein DYI37_00310 [Fulvimarina endophytica]|uniref:Serine hydrolase n=1 Tax=Fulvimarina endophytica TaxID=2293836 RepID=A0A371X9Q5_9HYPH|nr:hypothetical protein DYI37_00310 [Fulvimarina endophytica]